jgi:hypothetical protein
LWATAGENAVLAEAAAGEAGESSSPEEEEDICNFSFLGVH